jgi:hypothetical protein
MTDMKRNMLVAAGIALILAFSLNNSQAQNDAPPPGPGPAPRQPGPVPDGTNQPQFQRMPPPRFGRQRPVFGRALADLKMAKMELQHAQGDLGGHKDSAMEACDKAIQELAAVMKSLPQPPPAQRPIQPAGGTPQPGSPPGVPTPPPAAGAPPPQPQP